MKFSRLTILWQIDKNPYDQINQRTRQPSFSSFSLQANMHYIVGVTLLGLTSAFVCPPDYCDSVKQEVLNCAPESVLSKGGLCGCTDVCAKVILCSLTCVCTYVSAQKY